MSDNMGKTRKGQRRKITIANLRVEDITDKELIKVKDFEGIVVYIEYSWDELLVILLSQIAYTSKKELVAWSIENKISLQGIELLIEIPLITDKRLKDTYYKVPGTQYFIKNNLNPTEYIKLLNKLCKKLGRKPNEYELTLDEEMRKQRKAKATENDYIEKLRQLARAGGYSI